MNPAPCLQHSLSELFTVQAVYDAFNKAIGKHRKVLHSTRFNTRLHYAPNKARASRNFLKRAMVFSRRMVKQPLQKWSKRKLCIDMASRFGTLTAKNGMLYLEGFHERSEAEA